MAISKKELEKTAMMEAVKANLAQKLMDQDQQILVAKQGSSAAMFKNTKITSCSKIL